MLIDSRLHGVRDRLLALRTMPNYAGLADESLLFIAEHARERRFRAGEPLFAVDAPLTRMHFLIHGRVTTARQALLLLQAGKHFDVILSDVMMPEMSGMDLYEALVERFPVAAARVVFISGGAFAPGARAFMDRVGNERLEKPFDVPHVREVVRRMLEAASAPAAK